MFRTESTQQLKITNDSLRALALCVDKMAAIATRTAKKRSRGFLMTRDDMTMMRLDNQALLFGFVVPRTYQGCLLYRCFLSTYMEMEGTSHVRSGRVMLWLISFRRCYIFAANHINQSQSFSFHWYISSINHIFSFHLFLLRLHIQTLYYLRNSMTYLLVAKSFQMMTQSVGD